jgi:hypothetical protein
MVQPVLSNILAYYNALVCSCTIDGRAFINLAEGNPITRTFARILRMIKILGSRLPNPDESCYKMTTTTSFQHSSITCAMAAHSP